MTVRWITPLLGTAPAGILNDDETAIVDVRDLVDKAGNPAARVSEKIDLGCRFLREGRKTIVCCDYGISRSNAIAAGILASFEGIPLEAALRRVRDTTGQSEIKLGPLMAVRAALGLDLKARPGATQRTILLTGGNGFIGTALRRSLSPEFRLAAPARSELDLEAGSVGLDLVAAETKADMILHLANPRVFSSNAGLGKALTMLRNVIDVCATRELPMLFLSSWEIYSGYRGDHLAGEGLAPCPRGPDGETKYLCEMLIEHCRVSMGLRCALLRSGPVYGGSSKPKFIHHFIDKAGRGETIVTHRYLNGDPKLDLMHVDDLVAAIGLCVRLGFEGTLNLGTGIATSTREVAAMLKRMLHSESPIEQVLIEAETACIAMDNSLARETLGWQPSIALETGLARLLKESNLPERT